MTATARKVLLDVELPTSSPELDSPHDAGSAIAGQFQRCTACGEILVSAIDDEDEAPNFYAPGSRVGTDCPGRIAGDAPRRARPSGRS